MSDRTDNGGRGRRLRARAVGAGMVVVGVALGFVLNDFWTQVGLFTMASAVVAIGLSLLIGTAGQLSLGHGLFVAIGSFGYCYLASPGEQIGALHIAGAGVAPPLAAVLATLLAGLAGLLLTPIARRLQGLSLGVATLGLVFLTSHVLGNAKSVSGGFNGRTAPVLELAGFPIGDSESATSFGSVTLDGTQMLWILMLIVLLIGGWIARNLMRGSTGLALQAVRDQQLAAGVLGVNVTREKARVFFVSALYAGAGGVLLAVAFGHMVPDYFNLFMSINLVVMVVVGGLNSVTGAVIGAFLVTALPEFLSQYGRSLPLMESSTGTGGVIDPGTFSRYLLGAAIVVILLVEPDGLVGAGRRLGMRVRGWRGLGRPESADSRAG